MPHCVYATRMHTLQDITLLAQGLAEWLREAPEDARIDRLVELLEAERRVELQRRLQRERMARWRGSRSGGGRVEMGDRKAEEVFAEGRRIAGTGRAALEEWVNNLEVGDMGKVSLRQLREWRSEAERVEEGKVKDGGRHGEGASGSGEARSKP
jgi:hypothetical protein